MRGFPIVISSPSGGGKTTICNLLLREERSLVRVITATTRAPRLGEKKGVDYHYWTDEQFKTAVRKKMMAEWAKVHDHYYGVPKSQLDNAMDKGLNPVLIIDVQGAKTIAKSYPDAVLIFVVPPNWDVLESRLTKRRDNTENIRGRLETAKKEIAHAGDYHYIVVNDKLGVAVNDIRAIIEAEKFRAARQLPLLKKMKLK